MGRWGSLYIIQGSIRGEMWLRWSADMNCLNFVSIDFELIYNIEPYSSRCKFLHAPSDHRAPDLWSSLPQRP